MKGKDRKAGPRFRDKNTDRGRNSRARDAAEDKGAMSNRSSERAADSEGQVEGRNPVLEVLRSGRTVEKLLIAKGAREGSILEIAQKAKAQGIVVQEVDRRRLNELSMTDGAHQGVIAFVTPYSYVGVEDILERASRQGEDPFIIVLDEITDPYNLGSVIRTAECCGVHGVIIPKRRAAGLTPAAIKASAGAVEFVPVAKVTNISDTLDLLKRHGLWVAGADMDGETYTSRDLTGPLALVVGSEGRGLGRLVREKCDFLVRIPMLGRISSLNASVAAGVLMYEVNRQRSK